MTTLRSGGLATATSRLPESHKNSSLHLQAWWLLLLSFRSAFTAPSFLVFQEIVTAWVLAPGRRTLTRLWRFSPTVPRRTYHAYPRFFREGRWSPDHLWHPLALLLVAHFAPRGPIPLTLDDTLHHKTGRRVDGAGIFRDAVRSTRTYTVHAWGLNLVVLALYVLPPWGEEPLSLPLLVRLHRKKGPTLPDLAEEMVRTLASWFPTRSFRFTADGGYATLAGRHLPRAPVNSRMRRDAALYDLPPPPRKGRRGRPPKKGRRLSTPEVWATRTRNGWRRVCVDRRGRWVERDLLTRVVLWWSVSHHPVRLIAVRDPSGREKTDFFFTTDLSADPGAVVSLYFGRWSIEDCLKFEKQFVRGEDPQSWKGRGPERVAQTAFWLYSAVWLWYVQTKGTERTWRILPWYRQKSRPSFADALGALRRDLLWERVSARSSSGADMGEILGPLVEMAGDPG